MMLPSFAADMSGVWPRPEWEMSLWLTSTPNPTNVCTSAKSASAMLERTSIVKRRFTLKQKEKVRVGVRVRVSDECGGSPADYSVRVLRFRAREGESSHSYFTVKVSLW